MPDPAERIRQTLIERIRQVVAQHRESRDADDAQVTCSCGAAGISDFPSHVAEQIVDGLDLKAEARDHAKKQIRYATAWFDWELTQLEGAEC
jgi:GGDEF domain-containing protein